ncbi:MAG: DUF1176 domain-containing protein [Deltaproteobacteria bacterium]|nr:MAG: DUF1176 domain-containing protein [Deltaproteobacteria bacterium]
MKNLIFLLITMFSLTALAVDPTEGLPEAVKAKYQAMTAGECQTDTPWGAESFDLQGKANLYIVPCFLGAYQSGALAFTSDKFSNVQVVTVLSYDEIMQAVTATIDLMEPSFDPDTMTLSTYSKGRGLGDCGQTSTSKILVDDYGYVRVKTIEIRDKAECDGQYEDEWPVVFKQ